jgi:hypothetical protein
MNTSVYGLMAEFDTPEALLEASEKAYQSGYRKMDAYSPFPIEGLAEAIGFHHTRLPLIVLVAGICGALGGFAMEYYFSVIAYPLNIGGRPLNSWPSFIPITFELTILAAATTAVVAMIVMNGLPRPYHPVFNVPQFAAATGNSFFLCIEERDPKFDREGTRKFLQDMTSHEVTEVEP